MTDASGPSRQEEQTPRGALEVYGTNQIYRYAKAQPVDAVLSFDDFYAHMPDHKYIFAPAREMWPAASVNSRLPAVNVGVDDKGKDVFVSASQWLDQHHPVEQMTWAPGEPMLIRDRLISNGGWIERQGCTTFNLYRPPKFYSGDPSQASLWVNHVRRIYAAEADHIINWLAHRVQHPGQKINHALVLGGGQGIGKDTLLEPVKHAVGPWNFEEVSPTQMLGRFNGFLKSAILRISEARDLGEINRYAFYDHLKAYTAAPPDVLRCDEKNLREHGVLNVTGLIITTNHKADGIYLPADDRRHYVAWSDQTKEDFAPAYWEGLWNWYVSGGIGHVVTYLRSLNLSTFDPKASPPKTSAFFDIVDANRAPEDAELADVIDVLGNPDALTISDIINKAATRESLLHWLSDRKNRRAIPHRLENVGYVPVRNGDAKDGLWKVFGRRQAIYTRQALCQRDRLSAARKIASGGGK